MSFLDRLRGAPVEPSAEERAAAVRERCAACLTDSSALQLLDIGGGYGKQPVCEDHTACRERATVAGIWKRYP